MKHYETANYTRECDETGREYCFEVGFYYFIEDGRTNIEDVELIFEIALECDGERVVKLTADEEKTITEYVRVHDAARIDACCLKELDRVESFS